MLSRTFFIIMHFFYRGYLIQGKARFKKKDFFAFGMYIYFIYIQRFVYTPTGSLCKREQF